MMKRTLLFIAVALGLSAYTLSSGDSCPTKSTDQSSNSSRSLTCGSCHPTATIQPEIEGKLVEDGIMEFTINIPNSIPVMNMELWVSNTKEDQISTYSGGAVETVDEELGTQIVYELTQTKSTDKDREYAPASFYYQFPKDLQKSETIEVFGVLSNLDGSTVGDISFYEKFTLEPDEIAQELAQIASLNFNVFPTNTSSVINITGLTQGPKDYRIVNILGRTVLQARSSSVKEIIDVSFLDNGNYFLVIGNGKAATTHRFILKK